MGNTGGFEIYFGKHLAKEQQYRPYIMQKTACTCSLVYCFTRSTFQIIIGKKMSPVGAHKTIAGVF